MNNMQIFLEMLSGNGRSYIFIAVFTVAILLSLCYITRQIIGYLKYKHDREERIETCVLNDKHADDLKTSLSNIEKEISEIKSFISVQ